MKKALVLAAMLPLIALRADAVSCGPPAAPVGMRSGTDYQIYSGKTPQVYRVCKLEPVNGADDCSVEVLSDVAPKATLEKQSKLSCSCVDVEGASISVKAVPVAASCSGTSLTLWYENLRYR